MYNRHAISYDPRAMIAQDWRGWDEYHARQSRYEVYDGYYHNIAYLAVASYAETLKSTERLYKHVRGVFNPVSRSVELYTAKVHGGMLDTETATSGSIQLAGADDRLVQAITRVWQNSRWGQKKTLLVRNGAKFGDAFIKIVDDIQQQRVYMEVVNPSMIKRQEANSDGTITYLELEYYVPDYSDTPEPMALYGEIWTPDTVHTTLNGQPAAIHTTGRGEQVDMWQNEYGFVPFIHVQHRDVGLEYGATPFYTQLHKINELNDIASNINDAARNQANMPLIFKNARIGTADDFGADGSRNAYNRADSPKKDSKRVLEIVDADQNRKADVMTIPPTLSLTDAIAVTREILHELERDLPELSLHRLREGGNLTAPGVRSAYDDAIARIQEARGNYNAGLIEAHKMAVAIGGMRGYAGFEGFNLVSYANGDLEHNIAATPVIGDTLSKGEKISLTLQAMQANAPSSVYKEIGWDDKATDDLIATQQRSADMFMLAQNAPAAEAPPPDDPDATPQDVFAARQGSAVNQADIVGASALLQATA